LKRERTEPTDMDSSAEIIQGPKVKETLRSLISSGQMCKMEISRTPYCWLTLLTEVREDRRENLLLIDRVPDFEKALSSSRRQEVLVEYLENNNVPCNFISRVARVDAQGIWVELPEKIHRIQRRRFFRLRAPVGTEIVFYVKPEVEERGKVRDYSLGGVAFLIGKEMILKPGDQLKALQLHIPDGEHRLSIPIPLAVVRRVQEDFFHGETLYALEFLEYSEAVKKGFNQHIFEKQRSLLRRVKK
jgi:c-di-GMP-binding flagellar brake protein YcgR